jgi:2-dehydro-3-deoxyphosphogluconate aldolase / (4S)-4-hydroxy-2-oxoglutarate aldolase
LVCNLAAENEPTSLPIWLQHKVLPVIRANTPEEALWIAQCLHQVGVTVLEFTLTIPDVWQVVKQFKQKTTNNPLPIGMGSLKTFADLTLCLNEKMAFTASPGYIPNAYRHSAETCHYHLGGAITPSELNQVVQEGGQCVKLFPIAPLGGVHYFKTVTTPFPELMCIPFGGIYPNQVPQYFQAGAVSVGLGSQLMPPAGWFEDSREADYLAFLEATQLFTDNTNVAHSIR